MHLRINTRVHTKLPHITRMLALLCLFSPVRAWPQWTPAAGPRNDNPVALFSLAVRGDSIFAGAYRGGFYRSTDRGLTWATYATGIGTPNIAALYLFRDKLYAGTESGVYRSSDDGATWEYPGPGGPPSSVYSLAGVDSMLFAATESGVYRSSDEGVHWSVASSGLPLTPGGSPLYVNALIVKNGTLYAGTWQGVYVSTDRGSNWVAREIGPGVRVMALAFHGPFLFAGTNTADGIYRSPDGGLNWTPVNAGLPENYSGFLFSIYSMISVDGNVYAGVQDAGMYSSSDDGGSWAPFNAGFPIVGGFIPDLAVLDGMLLAGTFNGIFQADLPDTLWHPLLASFPGNIHSRAIISVDGRLLTTGYSNFFNGSIPGAFLSTDRGDSWQSDSSLGGMGVSGFARNGNDLFAYGAGVRRSTDAGLSWIELSEGLPEWNVNGIQIDSPKIYAATGGYWLNADDGGVYYSPDYGNTWTTAGLDGNYVRSVVRIGDRLFAGIGNYWFGGGVYTRTDEDSAWARADNGLPYDGWVYSIHASGNILFASSPGACFKSTDLGATWNTADSTLPGNLYIHTYYNAGSNLLIGSESGIFYSTDRGEKWEDFNTGLPDGGLPAYAFTVADSEAFVGTSEGVWRRRVAFPVLTQLELSIDPGWNLVSIPARLTSNSSKLFPSCVTTKVFAYDHHYQSRETVTHGAGYWMRAFSTCAIGLEGWPLAADTVSLRQGWNMIGSVTASIPVSGITSIPPGIIVSDFFSYDGDAGTYLVADSIRPWMGYWVKADSSGQIILSAGGVGPASDRVRFRPTGELPPPPPAEVAGENVAVPASYHLYQNNPNPFNPSTNVTYAIPMSGYVSVKIYDILGREVARLVDGKEGAGIHTVRWDGGSFPGGVYFYRMVSGGFTDTKKMVLVK